MVTRRSLSFLMEVVDKKVVKEFLCILSGDFLRAPIVHVHVHMSCRRVGGGAILL